MSDRWPRRPEVQGLRALAVLAVVAFHAGLPLRGGFVGVDVFFVISGWALTGGLVAGLADTGEVGLGGFLARRARRILPLLSVVVSVTLVAHVLTSNPYVGEEVVARTALAGITFGANLYLYRNTGYFDVEADSRNPLLHLWSLSAEEQMYLLVPVLLLVGWRLRGRLGAVAMVTLAGLTSAACAAVLATSALEDIFEAPSRLAFYSPVTRVWEVALGMVVALVSVPAPLRRAGGATAGAILGAVAVVVSCVEAPTGSIPFPAALPAVAGTGLLLACAAHAPVPSRVLGSAVPRWIGDRSYGWYLWHWPAIVVAGRLAPGSLAAAVAGAAVGLGLAAVTYPLVEQRFRHDRALVGPRAVAVWVAVLSLPASLAVVASTGHVHGWGLEEPVDWYDTPLGSRSGCLIVNREMPETWDPGRCTTPVDDRRGTVLVLGDSAVMSVVPAVTEVAAERAWQTAEWSRAGCPFTGRPATGYPRCERWLEAAEDLIDELDPDLVVIANRSLDYAGPAPGSIPGDPRPAVEGTGSRAERWRAALDEALDRLAARDVPVVVVGPVPDYGDDFPRTRLWPLRPHPEVPVRARSAVDADRAAAVAEERAVVAAHDGAVYVDPVPALCDAAACTPVRDGRWLASDAHHLNVRGSRLLTAAMRAAVDQVVP